MTVGASAEHTGRTVSTTPLMNVCQRLLPLDTFWAASAISSCLVTPGRPPTDAALVEKRRAAGRMAAERILTGRGPRLLVFPGTP